jgi:hypothetical protein
MRKLADEILLLFSNVSELQHQLNGEEGSEVSDAFADQKEKPDGHSSLALATFVEVPAAAQVCSIVCSPFSFLRASFNRRQINQLLRASKTKALSKWSSFPQKSLLL